MSAIKEKKEYHIVNASSLSQLNQEVNEKLGDGWEVHGDLQLNERGNTGSY